MLKYLLPVLFLVSSLSWATTVVTFFKPAGGATCTRLITQDDTNDYWCNDSILAQGLKITASTEVCEVQIYSDSHTPAPSGKIEFWSNADGTGTQYGTASAIVSMTANAWTTFTWSSNPTLTTDCYLVVRISGSPPDDFCWKSYTSATKYETSSYAAMKGGTAIDAGVHDFAFRLNSMQ